MQFDAIIYPPRVLHFDDFVSVKCRHTVVAIKHETYHVLNREPAVTYAQSIWRVQREGESFFSERKYNQIRTKACRVVFFLSAVTVRCR